jgi:hypothetical protein
LKNKYVLALISALVFLICNPNWNAWAQDRSNKDQVADDVGELKPGMTGTKKKSEETDTPKVKVERGAGGKKVYVIKTGFVIEGRIQKPNAFYVLQRSQINYDWSALKKRFVPKIVSAVKKSPF